MWFNSINNEVHMSLNGLIDQKWDFFLKLIFYKKVVNHRHTTAWFFFDDGIKQL